MLVRNTPPHMVFAFSDHTEWRNHQKMNHTSDIHRSIEKMCESLTCKQFIYVTSRMDYLSSHINNEACALCVEKELTNRSACQGKSDQGIDG